jgi:hypothetical protein
VEVAIFVGRHRLVVFQEENGSGGVAGFEGLALPTVLLTHVHSLLCVVFYMVAFVLKKYCDLLTVIAGFAGIIDLQTSKGSD